MSTVIETAVNALNEKLGGGFDGSAKFVIEGTGSIVVGPSGAVVSDDDADVTLSADVDTFTDMMSGDLNPTAAFMQGRLTIDGDMGLAMKLAGVLA